MTQHSPLPWMLHHKPDGLCAITSGRDTLVADDVRPADAELVVAAVNGRAADGELDLDALEKKEREATAAPWLCALQGDEVVDIVTNYTDPVLNSAFNKGQENLEFIAALRNAAPALIAKARRAVELEAENESLKRTLELKTSKIDELRQLSRSRDANRW